MLNRLAVLDYGYGQLTMNKFCSLIKIALVNSILIICGLVVAEILLRAYGTARSEDAFNLSRYITAVKNETYDHALNKSGSRHPYPYIEFKGAPFMGENNSRGFRFIEKDDKEGMIKVAFFGGSTGYIGDPPIPTILELLLKKKQINASVDNYSVISSNHNQHMHSVIENLADDTYDLVIFYGGYNELLQPIFYDPRPGYPYNFNLNREMSIEHQLLYKHSLIFRKAIDIFYGGVNSFLGIEVDPNSSAWQESIASNYMVTANTSRRISKSILTGKCEEPFLIIYQPYNYRQVDVPLSFEKKVHDRISGFIDSISWGINESKLIRPDSIRFTDIVHVDQKGNELIANSIVESQNFKSALKKCRTW